MNITIAPLTSQTRESISAAAETIAGWITHAILRRCRGR